MDFEYNPNKRAWKIIAIWKILIRSIIIFILCLELLIVCFQLCIICLELQSNLPSFFHAQFRTTNCNFSTLYYMFRTSN